MRRGVWILSSIILISIVAIAIAQSIIPPRHVDPISAPEESSPLGFIEALSLISSYAQLDIERAGELVGNVTQAPVPSSLRTLINRSIELYNQTLAYLGVANASISEAEDLVSRRGYREAEEYLAQALGNITAANRSLDAMRDILNTLSRVPQISQKVDQIYRSIIELIESLSSRITALNKTIAGLKNITPTEITISVSPNRVWIGGDIEISGSLRDWIGNPLPGRRVTIYIVPIISNTSIDRLALTMWGIRNYSINITTDTYGLYRARVKVNQYVETISIYSEYVPSGMDIGRYSYSRSESINVSIDYVKQILSVKINSTRVKPGEYLWIEAEALMGGNISIYTPFTKNPISIIDRGVTAIRIPQNASEGVYSIRVYTMPRGLVGPAMWGVNITVYKASNYVVADAPRYVFTGISYSIGVITSAPSRIAAYGPPGVSVRAYSGGVELYVPHSYLYQEVEITIIADPIDPGYKQGALALKIAVYNTIYTSILAALSMLAIALLIVRATRSSRATIESRSVEAIEPPPRSIVYRQPSGPIGLVHMILERISGARFEASYTYREYLASLRGRLGGEVMAFVEKLYMLLERLAYGGPRYRGLIGEALSTAWNVLARLRSLMRRGGAFD